MKKINKIISVLKREIIKSFVYLDVDYYMRKYTKYLKTIGIDFTGKTKRIKFVEPSAYFDGTDYSMIHIGDNVVISRDVMLLTHDCSLTAAITSIGVFIKRHEGEMFFKKDIYIGDNAFIGAKASLLPGTIIGNNCIVGACSVVKGNVPDYTMIGGILAKRIKDLKAESHD